MLISTMFLLVGASPGAGPQASPQLPKTKVTFQSGAVPAGRLLPLLGKSAGVSLITGPGMDADILVLGVKDAPLDEVMQRIAKVQLGRWQVRQDGSFELMANLAARTAQQEQLIAKRAAGFKKELDGYYASLAKKPAFDSAAAKSYMNDDGLAEELAAPTPPNAPKKEPPLPPLSPGNRAILRMLRSIPLRQIAALEDRKRIVFSTRPNRFQRPLGPEAGGAIATLIEDQRLLVQEAKRVPPQPETDNTSEPMGTQHQDAAEWTPEEIKEPPYKALLIITRRGTTATVDLTCYSQAGQALFSDTLFLRSSSPAHSADEGDAKPPKDISKEITLSEDARAMGRFMESFRGDPANFKQLPGTLLEKLAKPTEFDPLFGTAEAVRAFAAADGLQVVANLVDESSLMQRMASGGKLTTNSFRTALLRYSNLEQADGWLLVSPVDSLASALSRLDRQSLETLIAACKRTVLPTIDDMARFATANPRLQINGFVGLYFMLFVPDLYLLGAGGQGEQWTALRFYGSLGDAQKRTLLGSGKLAYGSLQPSQLSILLDALMNDELTIQVPRTEQPKPDEEAGHSNPWGSLFGNSEPSGDTPEDFRSEPTELLPNGPPMDGYVEARSSTEQGVMLGDEGGLMGRFLGIINPAELAGIKLASEMSPEFEGQAYFPKPKAMRLGERTNLNLQFWLTPGAFVEGRLRGGRLLPDTSRYEMNTLPKDFIALYQAAYEKMKAQAEKERSEPGYEGEPGEGNPP